MTSLPNTIPKYVARRSRVLMPVHDFEVRENEVITLLAAWQGRVVTPKKIATKEIDAAAKLAIQREEERHLRMCCLPNAVNQQ